MKKIEQSIQKTPEISVAGIDLAALRFNQNYQQAVAVNKELTRIPVKKPSKTDFFRVRDGEEFTEVFNILEIKDEGEVYLTAPALMHSIPGLLRPAMIYLAVDRRGNPFLIPVPLPGTDGRRNSWHQSLDDVVQRAKTNWLRSVANKALGGYEMHIAEKDLGDPEWPAASMEKLLNIAFRDRVIVSEEHPIIRQLLGYE